MLPRQHRLASGRDIARVYRKGRSARSDLFRISWLPTRRDRTRIAVVTSRKLSTKAVKRNLLKRQVRSIVADLLPKFESVDGVIQLLPKIIGQAPNKKRDAARQAAAGTMDFQSLKKDLVELLTSAKILGK